VKLTGKLTEKGISKLLGKPGRYNDGHGLILQVMGPHRASWFLRYERDGRERWHGLGSLATFPLATARKRAQEKRQLLADGIDPIDHKRAQKAAKAAEATRNRTFGQVALEYFDAHSPGWRHEKSREQWATSVLGRTTLGARVKNDYCRSLRPLPVATIGTPEVLAVLRPIWPTKTETASRIRARIAAVLDFARAGGYRQGDNPADAKLIGKLLPQRTKVQPVEHFAAMPYPELPQFLSKLRQREGSAAKALVFLILTAARTNEALGARWSEIDFENRLWIVPAERMKADREHRQPLSDAAIDLLHRLPGREDGNDLVFISSQPGKPLSAESLLRVLRRMGRLTESVHGFRSAFSDWCHERTAHSPHEIELSLAHSIGSAVEQAYRRTDLLERRRQLMESWGNYCTSPPREAETGETVVPMRSPR
jgi:integrase